MLILYLFPRQVRSRIQAHIPLKWFLGLLFWIVVILAAFMVSFKWTEGVSWEEAVWQTWQTATTVGYGNRPAETTSGRAAAMFFGLTGIAFLGTAISAAFDLKEYLRERKRIGLMKNPLKNGYVVFNFPGMDIFQEFLQEIRSKEEQVGICIVDNRLERIPKQLELMPDIHFVKGDTLSRETYEQAAVKENKIVVIFPGDPASPEADGATKTVVDLVMRFVGGSGVRVVYVLVKKDNAWMFDSRAVGIWQNIETLAVVQECQDPRSSELIQRILENTKGADPVTVVPSKVVGWRWGEFVAASMNAAQQLGIPVNPFAVISEDDVFPCPAYDRVIKETDRISILAEKDFVWRDFEKRLSG